MKSSSRELPDGSLVEDHVSVVGELLFEGVLNGFVVTKSFADAYGVYTMDDLNDSPEALAAFDATDPAPGNGKAEIYGCPPLFGACHGAIYNMIAFMARSRSRRLLNLGEAIAATPSVANWQRSGPNWASWAANSR